MCATSVIIRLDLGTGESVRQDFGLVGTDLEVVAGLLCIVVFCPLHAWKPAHLRSSLVCEAE